ncbi:cation diffusion facilitator family transporter [Gracilibacillus thailandensis]|uniref:Cation diffusion facilitator family transporter n=1 Tax=Gracilibacillus thailandensis TaxID=563735 RepID=A0A6N7R2L5_9BACI|nr:cation diffusion facilitator family transporter [Gracilibacillus thailandensis]MRI67139.1 cation diffusion facilitator family transporter [Gracilibacillus thailandensis]
MDQYHKYKEGEKGAWLSIITYILLATVKLVIATIGNSSALRADGLNNATDVVASIAVLIGLKISRKPPDEDHHYGHFRAEMIASLIAAFIMMMVGIQVLFDTVQSIIAGDFSQPDMLTAWTALGAAIVMFIVYLYNLRLGKKINSSALQAAAQDNKSDALVSIGAFVGIIGAQFQIYWLDPLAGAIVGLIICKTAWDIFREATHTLTDGFQPKELDQIKKSIHDHPDVLEIKDVKGRLHGNQALIEATIYVDPHMTVEESHDITDHIEEKLKEKHDVPHAHIHIEPYEDEQ